MWLLIIRVNYLKYRLNRIYNPKFFSNFWKSNLVLHIQYIYNIQLYSIKKNDTTLVETSLDVCTTLHDVVEVSDVQEHNKSPAVSQL